VEGFLIVYAAPEDSWVRLFVDGSETSFSNSLLREWRVSGLSPGQHTVAAHLISLSHPDEQERIIARDSLIVHTCLCSSPSHDGIPPHAVTPSLPALFNPYQPSHRYMHHEVFFLFDRWEGVLEEGYLTDWLGVRTRYAWDCIRNGGYYKFVPSRRLECEAYDRLQQDGFGQAAAASSLYRSLSTHTHKDFKGFLPPVDDEYPEYVDMLTSVVRSKG